MQTQSLFLRILICLVVMMLAVGCGGPKQTVTPPPEEDPFPKPEENTPTEPEQPPVEEPEPVADIKPAEKKLELRIIYFDYDKADLTSAARAALAENARQLQAYPDVKIRIEGHCDERGTVEYNLALGQRRAEATQNYLINFGIDASRIKTISFGKERPADPRRTEEAYAKNRRAEFAKLN